jgi:penicillin-binding protein-related factor A (putative recombinase)
MAQKNAGKDFEKDIKDSCGQDIFFYRIKDVFVPPNFRHLIPVSPNDFDCFVYSKPNLFCLELKSTQGTALSFDESIIKEHQIQNLLEASAYSGMICGLLINFRSKNNRTFFVEINEYLKYKNVAQNQIKEHTYKSKVNRSSIPFGICEEIGLEVKNELKRVHYRYFMDDFIDEAIAAYGNSKRKQRVDKAMVEDMEVEFEHIFEENCDLAEWARSAVPELFEIIRSV